jgi:hypothetical protein
LFDLIEILKPQAEAKEITLEDDLTDDVWVKRDANQLTHTSLSPEGMCWSK